MIAKGAWTNKTKSATNKHDLKLEKLKVFINRFYLYDDERFHLTALGDSGYELSYVERSRLKFVDEMSNSFINLINDFE